jgi:hypothetical protein
MKSYSAIHRILYLSLFIAIAPDAARGENGGDAPTNAPGCTVFFGGTGTRTGNSDFDNRWITVNKTVSEAAIQKLSELHYRIEPLVTEARESQDSFEDLYRALQQKHCDQVLQLSHELSLPSKPDSVPRLTFKVLVFHLDQKAGDRSAKIISEYERGYPFDLTTEVLQNLSLSEVGETIATDVDQAKVLTARGP